MKQSAQALEEKRLCRIAAIGLQNCGSFATSNTTQLLIEERKIIQCFERLLDLFDNIYLREISYEQACSLVKDLGGNIQDKTSGGSHKLIVFNNLQITQDIETQESATLIADKKTVGGIARKAEICGYNLKVLRNVISNLLPQDWRSLGASMSPKARFS